MKNKIIPFAVLMFIFYSNLFAAQKEDSAVIKGLRPMSMGGAFTAISDDENAFFYNPAGITQRSNYLFQILSIDAAVVKTTIFDFYNFYKSHETDFENFSDVSPDDKSEFIKEILDNLLSKYPNAFVSLPNILFITNPISAKENYLNFGLGVFSYIRGGVKINRGVIPSLSYNAKETCIGILPVAFKISSLEVVKMPGSLSLGMNLKYMYRIAASDNISIDDLKNYKFANNCFYGTSFGIDLGAIYHLNSVLNFGLNVADIYNSEIDYKNLKSSLTSGYTAKINPELNIGVSYYPKKLYYWSGKYWKTNDRLAFAFDLTDLANSDEPFFETPFKKFHIGSEYKYNPFVIRAGFNSGYPTIGGGIVTSVIQLEYAFYGEERGMYAGQDPEWFHRILFSVKLGRHKGKLCGKKKKVEVKKEQKDIYEVKTENVVMK